MASPLDDLTLPVVLAPMAGGAGTPELAAAVCAAGGLGFLPAGYLTPAALRANVADLRDRTDRPFGVNIFVPTPDDPNAVDVARYAAALAPLAAAHGVELGEPISDDDHVDAKLDLVLDERPAVVSFTFGLPDAGTIGRLRDAGIEVWATVTDPAEARLATAAGAEVLVLQGAEAGGHRGAFVDHDDPPVPLDTLLALVVADTDLPVVASGGLMDGRAVRVAVDAGARAAQLGTAFLLCPEAGTSAPHRRALALGRTTTLTRAFTGRRARGIRNAWTDGYADAPSAYPAVHHLTAPLRAHGRRIDDTELVNLWAGTAHAAARALPAGELMAELAAEFDG